MLSSTTSKLTNSCSSSREEKGDLSLRIIYFLVGEKGPAGGGMRFSTIGVFSGVFDSPMPSNWNSKDSYVSVFYLLLSDKVNVF